MIYSRIKSIKYICGYYKTSILLRILLDRSPQFWHTQGILRLRLLISALPFTESKLNVNNYGQSI